MDTFRNFDRYRLILDELWLYHDFVVEGDLRKFVENQYSSLNINCFQI